MNFIIFVVLAAFMCSQASGNAPVDRATSHALATEIANIRKAGNVSLPPSVELRRGHPPHQMDQFLTRSHNIKSVKNPIKRLRLKQGVGIFSLVFGVASFVSSTIAASQATHERTVILKNQKKILDKLGELNTKLDDFSKSIEYELSNLLSEVLQKIEDAEVFLRISKDLNTLENAKDNIQTITMDSKAILGPSILFDSEKIPIEINEVQVALHNFHRYMSKPQGFFEQKPLLKWYICKYSELHFQEYREGWHEGVGLITADSYQKYFVTKYLHFKKTMRDYQIAGYTFWIYLAIAECQQNKVNNDDKLVGSCWAGADGKVQEIISLAKERLRNQPSTTIPKCPYSTTVPIYVAPGEEKNYKPEWYPLYYNLYFFTPYCSGTCDRILPDGEPGALCGCDDTCPKEIQTC